jgi:hypothetical protein
MGHIEGLTNALYLDGSNSSSGTGWKLRCLPVRQGTSTKHFSPILFSLRSKVDPCQKANLHGSSLVTDHDGRSRPCFKDVIIKVTSSENQEALGQAQGGV